MAKTSAKPAMLIAAVGLAQQNGLHSVTREQIAKASNMAESTVSYHFGEMPQVRRAIVKYAVEREILSIIKNALVSRETYNVAISAELRARAS